MIRRTVVFIGRVQGVGFRQAVTEAVGDAEVGGFVRNLPDMTVEAVFEGEPDAVEAVLARVREAMASNILAETTADAPATGEFEGFTIRR